MKELKKQSYAKKFLYSAIHSEGYLCSCKEALEWVEDRKRKVDVNIEITKLSNLSDWLFNKNLGRVEHYTGKFFSIDAIDVKIQSIDGSSKQWSQPIINQPEIGFLGCIVKEYDGLLYFLVQAKIEPGNVNKVQISPTLQATRSNYTKVHRGNAPKYLEYFNNHKESKIIIDQLHSEQGARFLKKRNRNIIVEVEDDIELTEDFKWLTLGQIKKLSGYDNLINMDLRTVISCIPFNEVDKKFIESIKKKNENGQLKNFIFFDSLYDDKNGIESINKTISWLTDLKSKTDITIKNTSLKKLEEWDISDEKISHYKNLYFDILWVNANIRYREVASWGQPILAPIDKGVVAFIIKKINRQYYFLVQAEIECGHLDVYELGPTVSCVENNHPKGSVPFLELLFSVDKSQILYDSYQSEEGGRFYHEQNRNMIIEVEDIPPENIPSNFRWIAYNHLLFFNKFNNFLNIGARSLLSLIRFD